MEKNIIPFFYPFTHNFYLSFFMDHNEGILILKDSLPTGPTRAVFNATTQIHYITSFVLVLVSDADLTFAPWNFSVISPLMRSAKVNLLKSLAHTNTKGHQVCPCVTQSALNSTPRWAGLLQTKAAIIWVLPEMPGVLLSLLFNSLLSNYHRPGTGEESGLIRSFLSTCSQNTQACRHTNTNRQEARKHVRTHTYIGISGNFLF